MDVHKCYLTFTTNLITNSGTILKESLLSKHIKLHKPHSFMFTCKQILNLTYLKNYRLISIKLWKLNRPKNKIKASLNLQQNFKTVVIKVLTLFITIFPCL